jgi:GAF domain-containing protein
MSREQAIAEAFVELSDTLVADIDVVEFVRLLTRRSVQLLDVELAGVMVADLHGVLRLTAASSEYRRLLELFENDVAPCVDSFVTGEMVAVPDLDADGGRWPQFTRQARVAGFRAVYALPMRLRGEVIGVLALLRGQAGPLRDGDVRLGQALANVTTVGLLQHRTLAQRRVLGEQLRHVLNSRVLIEQAKGVLAERLGLDIDAALDELSRLGERVGRPLADIARAVVDGDPATARSDTDPRTDLVVLVRGFDLGTLDVLHDVVDRRLLAAGLAEPVRNRLVRAIRGAAVAAVGHGGSGRLWLWSRAGSLWCEVGNGVRGGPVDVTAPAVAARGLGSGDGLWVSDQIDDDLVILTDPTDGTRLLRYRLPAPVPPEHG